jgi:3-methylfumaryl-CoA hydratase
VTVRDEDVALWRTWVGQSETREERLDVEAARRFAAAIGEDLDVERRLPSLAHWAFFLPVAPALEVGEDGHPKRGGLLPPVTLPRRMFAAAEIAFHSPLQLGREASLTTEVEGVIHKKGRSGDLVLVEIVHRVAQHGEARLTERQTLVYREAGAPTEAIVPSATAREAGDTQWQPTTTDLFRFSAATFNGHRIHYDRDYAIGAEGYPGLVVHGPFIAARLFGLLGDGARPRAFAFRAQAPIFQGQPAWLRRGDLPGSTKALRCDGVTAMEATAEF